MNLLIAILFGALVLLAFAVVWLLVEKNNWQSLAKEQDDVLSDAYRHLQRLELDLLAEVQDHYRTQQALRNADVAYERFVRGEQMLYDRLSAGGKVEIQGQNIILVVEEPALDDANTEQPTENATEEAPLPSLGMLDVVGKSEVPATL